MWMTLKGARAGRQRPIYGRRTIDEKMSHGNLLQGYNCKYNRLPFSLLVSPISHGSAARTPSAPHEKWALIMAAFVYLTPDKTSRNPSRESWCDVTSRRDRSRVAREKKNAVFPICIKIIRQIKKNERAISVNVFSISIVRCTWTILGLWILGDVNAFLCTMPFIVRFFCDYGDIIWLLHCCSCMQRCLVIIKYGRNISE